MKLKNPDEARRRTLEHMRRATRPTLIGPVAVELGCSLSEASGLFEDMVADGLVRPVTATEMDRFDVRDGYVLVV